jgi:5-methylcytosine-specific restriction endonuclease McrA
VFAEHPLIVNISDLKKKNAASRSIATTDHIDGNHNNNSPDNLQTLCPTCHNVKTIVNGDNVKASIKNEA